MSRLITFGCSHTYGTGLSDISTTSGPSQLAWPTILSKDLKLTLENKSFPGWSNKRILYEILNFTFKKDDIVVILWAAIDRDVLYLNNGSEYHVGSWNEDEFTRDYYSLHTDLDLAVGTLSAIHHADCFLNLQGIKTCHLLYTNKFYKTVNLAKKKCKWFNTKLDFAFIRGMAVDTSTDGHHYGEKTHVILSNYIKKIFMEKI